MQNIQAAANGLQDYTIQNRRWFHQHPELSMQELCTAQYIRQQLTDMGIPYTTAAGNGTIGVIQGKKPGKTVLLRADMDALPVQEENDFPYASENPGVMHACGHDSHMAMLLTAARILKEREDELCGTVKLCFQLSEENGQGAIKMVEEGILDGVDACFACHVWADLPSGSVAVAPGPVMAAANKFEITVNGTATHGAAPHKGADAITTACALVGELQTIVSREIDPQDPCVITVSAIHSGAVWNIVADKVTMLGTTRCYSNEVNAYLPGAMERILKNVCEAHRCTGSMEYTSIVGPVINDPVLSGVAAVSARKIFGEDSLVQIRPLSAAEDYHYFLQKVPGIMCIIGMRNPEIDAIYANHHSKFKIDEAEMIKGAALYAQMAVDFLSASKFVL